MALFHLFMGGLIIIGALIVYFALVPYLSQRSEEKLKKRCQTLANIYPEELPDYIQACEILYEKLDYEIKKLDGGAFIATKNGNHTLIFVVMDVDETVGWKIGSLRDEHGCEFYTLYYYRDSTVDITESLHFKQLLSRVEKQVKK